MLRTYLGHLENDPGAAELAARGGSAFVSQSLRAFVVAGLADQDARRPAVVVVGDDRGARDLAADRRAWLPPAPRAPGRPPCARGSPRGPCATPRAAASPTSPTSRRRRTSWGCGSERSM